MSRCSNAHTVRCDPMAPPCQVMAAAPPPPPFCPYVNLCDEVNLATVFCSKKSVLFRICLSPLYIPFLLKTRDSTILTLMQFDQ